MEKNYLKRKDCGNFLISDCKLKFEQHALSKAKRYEKFSYNLFKNKKVVNTISI